MARWAGARLRLPRLVFAGIQTVRAWARRPDVWEVAHAPGSADYAYDAATEARIAANLAAFRDYVRGHGVRLGLVVSPPEFSLDARHPQHADALRQYQTWLRLARPYHEWDSGHLNPRGHRLAAEAIAHWLPEAFDWR
jgi:lysophospholipase L1-like esterase